MTNQPVNHIKLSMSLDATVAEALALEARDKGTEMTHLIQRVLGDHAADAGFMPEDQSARLRAFWWLVDTAKARAQEIVAASGPHADITARACAACEADPVWLERYEGYIGGPARAIGNPEKGPVNREIGFRIREVLDAEVLKKDGKSVNQKVAGSIIQSFTPFARIGGRPTI